MIESSCHCGAIKLKVNAEMPDSLLSCNCSICKRMGALMAYFPEDKVEVISESDSFLKYIWGDKKIALVNCKTCGCFSHWQGIPPKDSDKMGVNARLFTNTIIDKIPVRRFDGADTWEFLD